MPAPAGTKAFSAKGTVLSIGTTPILQVKSFAFSGVSAKYEDVTNLSSPLIGTSTTVLEESIPSAVSAGTATISGVLLPSDPGQTALTAAFLTQALTEFKLQLPVAPGQTTTGNLYDFWAYVQDQPLPETVDTNKPITFKVTLKLNTAITITPGA